MIINADALLLNPSQESNPQFHYLTTHECMTLTKVLSVSVQAMGSLIPISPVRLRARALFTKVSTFHEEDRHIWVATYLISLHYVVVTIPKRARIWKDDLIEVDVFYSVPTASHETRPLAAPQISDDGV